jgi:aspartyl protease family protein
VNEYKISSHRKYRPVVRHFNKHLPSKKIYLLKKLTKIFTISLLCVSTSNLFAQTLTVDETIEYIKTQTQKYKLKEFTNGAGFKFSLDAISLEISQEGFFRIIQKIHHIDFMDKVVAYESAFDFHDVIATIDEGDNSITLKCKKGNCIQELPSGNSVSYVIIKKFNKEGLIKLRNAYDYLLKILQYDERYNIKDNDPFSKFNFKKNITVDSTAHKIINLDYDGNISTLTVNVSGIIVTMILDSGASDVSISPSLENKLIEYGIITKENYLEPGLYKLADGSVVTSKRLKIPYLKVGAFEVKDIVCSVNPSNDVLLLGKSFLNIFSKWTIDNNKHILILEK